MKTVWTQHLRGEDKQKFEDLIRNSMSKAVIDRLMQIIENEVEVQEMNKLSYDIAAWPYYQAHCNGYKEAMRNIQSLFDLGATR
jgi:protoporphyrinogen oxidase